MLPPSDLSGHQGYLIGSTLQVTGEGQTCLPGQVESPTFTDHGRSASGFRDLTRWNLGAALKFRSTVQVKLCS